MPLVRTAGKSRFHLAGRAAAVARNGVAIIALLGPCDDAVPARSGNTGSGDHGAGPPGLELAGRAATVAGNAVPIVALFGPTDPPITTHHSGDARLTGYRTDVVGLDDALGAAAVAARGVPVVTFLSMIEGAVAATRTGRSLDTFRRILAADPRIRYLDSQGIASAAIPIYLILSASSGSTYAAATPTGPATNDSNLGTAGAEA